MVDVPMETNLLQLNDIEQDSVGPDDSISVLGKRNTQRPLFLSPRAAKSETFSRQNAG